jgi:hypothetical protein
MNRWIVLAALAAVPLACGKEKAPKPPPAPAGPTLELTLSGDPGTALSVMEAKAKGSGEEVTVVGRISTIVKGRGVFNLVDEELYYCGKGGAEDLCKTPWDYCCVAGEEVAAGTLSVEVRGPDGKPRAGSMPSLRLLDLLVVKGTVEKDEHGNVTVVAVGWHRRERPDLPEGLHWPE